MEIKLEIEKVSKLHPDEVFYRYAVGNFHFWFTQNIKNGNIYVVYICEHGDALKDFELHIYANEDSRGDYYPNDFTIRGRSQAITTAEAKEYVSKMQEACAVLDEIENFFKTSRHHDLYIEKRK